MSLLKKEEGEEIKVNKDENKANIKVNVPSSIEESNQVNKITGGRILHSRLRKINV